MSQADYSNDAGLNDSNGPVSMGSGPSVPTPPTAGSAPSDEKSPGQQPARPPTASPPPVGPPPTVAAPTVPPRVETSGQVVDKVGATMPPAAGKNQRPASTNREAVVPPPPPPRSTLPPVRQAADGRAPSGVGWAKGVRWRGELDGIKNSASMPPVAGEAALPPEDMIDPGEDRFRFSAPPWLVSLIIHLVFLLALALITTPAGSGIGKFILTMGSADGDPNEEITDFDISTDTLVEADSVLPSEVESEMNIELPELFEAVEDSSEAPTLVPLDMGLAASESMQPMFGGRTGALKASLMSMFGGTAETQDAVKRGLLWLQRNQKKKGGWSMMGPYRDGNHSENETSATAMAMLAFLGDGHTHRSGDYTDEMEKAMKYLVAMQDRTGFMARSARGHEQMYSQAQATIALCELYGMTKDSWLRPRVELAVDFAQKAQSDQGGWRYTPNQDSDTSVTGWFVLALKSAQSAGIEVDDSKLRHVSDYLDTAASYEGAAYSYQPRGGPSPAMTAEGLLCRQYLGWNRDDVPMVRGIEALSMDYPFDANDQDVYYWYYATQALHHFGGSAWRNWNDIMKVELPKMQIRSGREDGSWSPQGDAYGSYGRLYTTCLSIYCLEVYYRHMPLYQVGHE
ncbi:prenyltransferase/squalene oxidase repeat-containing protein [Rubripirellula reticaptiva]|uniref:Squalene cyclase C-terminal domain-containing protein n=1 Tax=Rubripirellula reticaptiva TaxID=2528013 RepID=A0A5C6ECP2_9BACT|nr:prenyltransferase/squalene oxidase repeat-containing protein [Rubripirellula reticaptiva]TWU46420.1 hypothetical protein Poly59_53620 [Rubripirellula reticaptiva]